MDKCKFCDAELQEGAVFCGFCGKKQDEEVVDEVVETAECDCQETCCCDDNCECGEECCCECDCENEEDESDWYEDYRKEKSKKSKKVFGVIGIILAGIAVLGALAYFLIPLFKPENANDVLYKDNYTVSDSELAANSGKIVATMNDQVLDNAELQLYYWSNTFGFLNQYAAYGLVDTTKGLHEQAWDDQWNYQQFFLDTAFSAWQEVQALRALAIEAGYQLPEDVQAELDGLPAQLEESLAATEYATVDEMLQAQYYPGTTQAGFIKYLNDYYTAYGYLDAVDAALEITDEEIETYFAEHEAGYAENGVTKTEMNADVRHILIQADEETEEAWAAAYEKAEALLNEWKNGAATEDSFAALVSDNTADGGSAATGGLYTDITPTSSYVTNFLNWAVDTSRVVGDTGIVETEYGYHIMYYVGGEMVETDWKETVKTDISTEIINTMIEDGIARWPMNVNFKNVVLGDMSLSG